jgi:hypothetical protein
LRDAQDFQNFKRMQSLAPNARWIDYVAFSFGYPPQRFPYDRPVARLLMHCAEKLNPPPDENKPGGPSDLNPLKLTAGGKTSPQALHPEAYEQLLMNEEDLKVLPSWQITDFVLGEAMKSCKEKGVKFILLFFPSKERLYMPLIEKQIDHDQFYGFISPHISEATRNGADRFFRDLRRNQSSVSNLVAALCKKNGAVFIDTTKPLTDAALQGDFPFLSYDIHFNLKGHEVVAKYVLDSLHKEGLVTDAAAPGSP